jgi:hypothetical protein
MVEENIYIIYIMANEWVEFVEQYAKENNISYSHTLKEAGSAYQSRKKRGKSTLRGKGLGDLPDVLQKNIVDNLDDKSLGSLSNTGREFNRNEYTKKRIVQVQFTEWSREVADVLREFNPTMRNLLQPWNTDYATFCRYYDK